MIEEVKTNNKEKKNKDVKINGERKTITIPINQKWKICKTKDNKIYCKRAGKKNKFEILFVPKMEVFSYKWLP